MIKECKYSKKFVSNSITNKKYNELLKQAKIILEFKNELSQEVYKNIMFYMNMGKYEFVTYIRKHFKKISSHFDSQAISEVFVKYESRFNSLLSEMSFNHILFEGFKHVKLKSGTEKIFVKNKIRKTKLSACLTYLSKNCRPGVIEYIRNEVERNSSKSDLYRSILYYVEKIGEDRLMNVAKMKNERIIRDYNRKPVVFKSLSFRGRSRKNRLIEYNKNYKSSIKAFIHLSWPSIKSMYIPVKFSKDYHGNMNEFEYKTSPGGSHDYEYIMTFDDIKKRVFIHICKDGYEDIPCVNKNDNVIGIDVNVKNNLMTLSDGKTYDYNRKLVKEYIEEVSKLKGGIWYKSSEIGKRKRIKLKTIMDKIHKYNERVVHDLCEYLKEYNIRHIVMEDLSNGMRKTKIKDSMYNINLNDLMSLLRIRSLNKMVSRIAKKNNIAVSTVQPGYTSKMCQKCGFISKMNRVTQENFECVRCGHKDNADINSAINIKNRVCVTVLCNSLLKKKDNGAFEPKNINFNGVRSVLLSYHSPSL